MREALDALIAEMVDKGILFEEARLEFERRFIKQMLERSHGKLTVAARRLGIHRNTLSRRMTELQLDVDGRKKPVVVHASSRRKSARA